MALAGAIRVGALEGSPGSAPPTSSSRQDYLRLHHPQPEAEGCPWRVPGAHGQEMGKETRARRPFALRVLSSSVGF